MHIWIQAPPVDGKANAAAIAYLREWFGVSASAVRLVSGSTSRTKVFELEGVSHPTARA